jgi:hypothetical protein
VTIHTHYLAKGHTTEDEGKRFVRATYPAGFFWCLRGACMHDIAQGTCDASDLPDDVREAAEARMSRAFSYVEWPR